MTDKQYPNVTIVSSNPLRDDMCNGILMRSLFSSWPRERLAQVYFRVVVPHLPNGNDCHDYRMIGLTGSVRQVASSLSAASIQPTGSSCLTKVNSRQRLIRKLKQRGSLFPWLQSAQELWAAQPWIGRSLERQLRELRPDIVYALMGNYSLTKITTIACQKLGIPLFVHVTDDFVTALYQGRPLASKLQAGSQRWLDRAVDTADGLAAISPVMAREYGRRFQKEWGWFTTLIDADAYEPSPRKQDGTIHLVYAGSLGLGRWESLRALATALKGLRDQQGAKPRLTIYSSAEQLNEHRRALDIPGVTDLRGWLPPSELPRVFHEADVLVHAESFQPSHADFTRLSFSTKLSQYMMAGRCILAIGPENLGSIRVLLEANAAVAIGQPDSDSIQAGLQGILADSDTRQRLARNGREWARKNVDLQSGQENFRQEIVKALEDSRGREQARAA